MPQIIITLSDEQMQLLKETLSYNGNLDLAEETFSGSGLDIGLTPFGNTLMVTGYKNEDLGFVQVEFVGK